MLTKFFGYISLLDTLEIFHVTCRQTEKNYILKVSMAILHTYWNFISHSKEVTWCFDEYSQRIAK